jgi:long-subunit acyl-CoA synthetase (AMP-forming)
MGDWDEKQTIGLLPERAAGRWGAREALAFQGRRWTFAELHAGVDAAARGLLQLGIAPGDMTGFGMSEIGIATLSALDSTEAQCVEANGYPLPGGEVRVVDPATGLDQPVSVPGEILARSYMVTQGHYKKPEDTARALDKDGWFHTAMARGRVGRRP